MIIERSKEKTENMNQKNTFDYMELLSNNASQPYNDYAEEAAILHKQISEPTVFNVAVVAKYGAGKSSVIDTYLSNYRNGKKYKRDSEEIEEKLERPINPKKNKYARISLASFGESTYDETGIERSILQQLFYSRKKRELPNSKIERTNKTSIWQVGLFAILLTLFIACITLLGITLNGNYLFGINKEWAVYLAIIVILAVLLLWIGLYYRKLKRIKYKDLEAEFIDDKERPKQSTNLINKFVDEVLYFFECVDINLVIFEDLDRLPTTEIFVKLRELNTIINASNKKAEKVTFLYAVKDNLFKTEEERAKFFEFILPVIPVVNPVTTYSILKEKIDKIKINKPKMGLSDKFMKGISVYIPDMRILKNTYNDYLIMFHKIFDDEKAGDFLDCNKLFSLCLYKNLFPYDYALLEKNRGLIPMVINPSQLREKSVSDILAKITEIKNKMQELQSESVKSFEELKSMFIGQLAQLPHGRNQGTTDAMTLSTFEGLNYETLRHPIPKIINNYYGANVEWRTVELPQWHSELLTIHGESYLDKEKRLKEISEGQIEKLKRELAILEKQKQEVSEWSVAQIILNQGIDICFYSTLKDDYMGEINLVMPADDKLFLDSLSSKFVNKIDASTIAEIADKYKEYKTASYPEEQIEKQINYLRFLVAQNYIDEHYLEYTSNFKANLLSVSDTMLIQAIQQKQKTEFNANVENLSELIRWLDDSDFVCPSILIKPILSNIDVIYKLHESDHNDQRFDNLMGLISDVKNGIVFEKIRDFIMTSEEAACEKLLSFIVPYRVSICEEVLADNQLTEEKKDLTLVSTIKYSEQYEVFNGVQTIIDYVNQHDDYLTLLEDVHDNQKVKAFVDVIKPQIEMLDHERGDNSKIQKYIIDNNYYAISLFNLEVIFCIHSSESEFYSRNYDMMMESKKEHVLTYITDNLSTYVQMVLLNEEVTCEKEPLPRMEKLLKCDTINIDLRKDLIKKIYGEFDDINDFDQELFATLVEHNTIQATWKNILSAYKIIGFSNVKFFIMGTSAIYDEFETVKIDDNNVKKAFINDLLKESTIEEIEKIASKLLTTVQLQDLILSEISDDNLSMAIDMGIVKYSNSDLSKLNDNHDKALNKYMSKYGSDISREFDVFFDIALPNITQQQERVVENGRAFFRTHDLPSAKENAQKIIANVIACSDCELAIRIKLIKRCCDIIDITAYADIYAEFIILNCQAVPNSILWQFTNVSISKTKKLDILKYCNYGIDSEGVLQPEKIRAYLKSCDAVYVDLFDYGKAKIEKTPDTTKLLKILEKYGIVKEPRKLPLKDEYSVKAS